MSLDHVEINRGGGAASELPLSARPEVGQSALSGLWSLYYRRGYEDGYREVVRDLLGQLVVLSEEFLKGNGKGAGGEERRKLVYAFEDYLERQIEGMAHRAGFVEGGLGI